MKSNNDRVIMVPIPDDDLIKNVTSLPRTHANDGYVNVNLKRMKSMKKVEMQEVVQPEQLLAGLEYLRQNHPDYKDVVPSDIIEAFMETNENNDDSNSVSEDEIMNSDLSSDEDEHEEKDEDSVFCSVTCLVPENPTAQVLVNDTNETIKKKTRIESRITTDIATRRGQNSNKLHEGGKFP